MAIPSTEIMQATSSLAPELTIKIIHSDESIIVIDKPCNLRSVPGHAQPPPVSAPKVSRNHTRKRAREDDGDKSLSFDAAESSEKASSEGNPSSQRRTAQEAWVCAIQSLTNECTPSGKNDADVEDWAALVQNLTQTQNLASIPRKLAPFFRYCKRNINRLLPAKTAAHGKMNNDRLSRLAKNEQKDSKDDNSVEELLRRAFEKIKERQYPLLNLPEPTALSESALGQLILMGYGKDANGHGVIPKEATSDYSKLGPIYVVHRLDCQTSGVMVFARTAEAASNLSQAWRERDRVKKLYYARVKRWPPFHDLKEREGTIDLPLAPSTTERIVWEVCKEGGRPSQTMWRVHDNDNGEDGGVTLALTPITGRTHQLRIHCAAIGSGIEGDSLYGDNPIHWQPGQSGAPTLCLHAQNLKFPHPTTGEVVEFESPCPW